MTARQVFESMLIEVSKVNAPSLLLSEFNYLFNKAINNYINKRYNIYDVNQQTGDDLQVLKSTAVLEPVKASIYDGLNQSAKGGIYIPSEKLKRQLTNLYGATYEVDLPSDYYHILNCICVFEVKDQWKCYDKGTYMQAAAKRLTADSWSQVINDYYNRPTPEHPYFYIHNVNQNVKIPTNPITENKESKTSIKFKGTDYPCNYITFSNEDYKGRAGWNNQLIIASNEDAEFDYFLTLSSTMDVLEHLAVEPIAPYKGFRLSSVIESDTSPIYYHTDGVINSDSSEAIEKSVFPNAQIQENRVLVLNSGEEISTIEKNAQHRYGNSSNVRMEIRYGKDDSVFELTNVIIDYLKTPQYIRLTQEQMDLTADYSQVMEFPDYVCQEIINELTILVMGRDADPRLSNQLVLNQTIANPATAQQDSRAAAAAAAQQQQQ